jgi:cardiolipin synthase C
VTSSGIREALTVERTGLPSLQGRTQSAALADTGATRLGRAAWPLVEAHPGLSGILPLRDAREAFAARALLAEAAERSLDVQYYIWRNDLTGTLLFERLCEAADRGVRVRLLLDDNNTSGLDATLAALDSHPNIEVRLFNPFALRKPRALGYAMDFARLNRRMHNKSFTADNQATIVGGRNVGDEYFGATRGVLFADLDVLAIGPVVQDVSRAFDRYWSSGSAYPVERVLPAVPRARIAAIAAAARQIEASPEARSYVDALRDTSLVGDLTHGVLEFDWAATRVVCDDPDKGLGRAAPESLLYHQLEKALGEPRSELELVSPYFVPTSAGVAWFARLARKGVEIQILTNALEATDVAFVHAGYAKRRIPLLREGIKLHELRRTAASLSRPRPGGSGSSGASLHAKTFSIDRSRVFVGSFNFDPRSAKLNTEMGFVIESPGLARQIDEVFRTAVLTDAYELQLSESGQLCWLERRGTEMLKHRREPGTSSWQRAWVWFLSTLPIEWLL